MPSHLVAQQVPCAQMPELQSALAAQLAPIGRLPQLSLTQLAPDAQSALTAHVVAQAPLAPQRNGPQSSDGVVRHVPSPSQRPANVSVSPAQPASRQVTPRAYFSQAPAPSQNPSVPQLPGPLSSQSLRGSVPISAAVHVPRLPAAAHV